MNRAKILIVDDEKAIGEMVEIILQKEGFQSDLCFSYQDAQPLIKNNHYDLHILDIMLPDGTGLELAKNIRSRSDAPIFFLTAKASDADVLRGFMHGADDYITKPFNPLELAARVKVQTERYLSSATTTRKKYDYGAFQLDVEAATLFVNGKPVSLTQKQLKLLELFCIHPNQVLSKEQLYEQIWGLEGDVDDNTIMVHIRKLREKLEADPSHPVFLVTVRGIGYKLQV
ncbi:response regulator transcription factor [Bacillaceae bacterium SIJ1]|uniref:response regulator transcription factor n=1 Tax=Litoribacterium kuwaitense TaxID=1398745 RepID=UPI0013EC293C|nr:response regulator transcription factor [Litoribacterium kuwaitense]NGP46344.1 response regulator transcription factor [Litoribacterium kuwaitense]